MRFYKKKVVIVMLQLIMVYNHRLFKSTLMIDSLQVYKEEQIFIYYYRTFYLFVEWFIGYYMKKKRKLVKVKKKKNKIIYLTFFINNRYEDDGNEFIFILYILDCAI